MIIPLIKNAKPKMTYWLPYASFGKGSIKLIISQVYIYRIHYSNNFSIKFVGTTTIVFEIKM